MRFRRFGLLFVLFVSSCLIAFSGVSIEAAAASTARQMTSSEVRSFYGDSFSASYKVSSNTYTTTFQYIESGSLSGGITGMNLEQNGVVNSISDFANYQYVIYQASFDHYYNDYSIGTMTIDALGTYFPDYVRGGIACSCFFSGHSWNPFLTSSDNSRSQWANNKWGIYQALSANPAADSNLSNYYGAFIYDGNFYRLCAVEGDTGLYLAPLQFQNVFLYSSGGQWIARILILCPWVAADPLHDPALTTTAPETTAPSGTGDINVNVDMTETNNILTTIANGISGFFQVIIDALSDLFLPDEDYVKNWADDVKDLLESQFLGTGVNVDPLIDAFEDLATYGATTSVRFPGIDLNIANTNFSIPARSVDLRPMEDSGIYGYIETAINIAATLSVFNLVQRKIKALLVGERVVEVEGDDD